MNASYGFASSPTNGDSTTNVSVHNNTIAVASSALPYFGWAQGIGVAACSNNTFYSNTITLNLANVVTNPLPSPAAYSFTYNVGIAVVEGSSNYFSNNTLTVSPAQYVTNGSGYYGIAVNQMFLNTNFNNFTNNIFTNGGLGVLATNYPFGSTLPNTDNTNTIQANIASNNVFIPHL